MRKQNDATIRLEDFQSYTPKHTHTIREHQARALSEYIRSLEDNVYKLIYIWRFAFGMDCKTIQRLTNCENTNGIVEAFRFSCQRHLGLFRPISDTGMRKAFLYILPDYEIIFLSAGNGICWVSGRLIDASIVQDAADEALRR